MEKITEKKYKFSFGECNQFPLTLRKDIAIAKIFAKLDIPDNLPDQSVLLVLRNMLNNINEDIFVEFIRTILTPVDCDLTADNILNMSNPDIQLILTDFFYLNPEVLRLFGSIKSGLGTLTLNTK